MRDLSTGFLNFFYLISGITVLLIGCQSADKTIPDGFQIHPDFNLSLVAAEPRIHDPVDLEFDENGDAYVLEMPGYPNEDDESRIVVLQDNDGDGIYDSSSIYAENLKLASSIMPYKKGFLVAAPPYLLFLKDTNGDKKADERTILMSGFKTGNLQHNYNGLTFGLDNWIYAANGGNSGAPFWAGDSSTVLNLREDDFRFQLTTKQLERVGASSGGYELGVDEYGHLFETHNLEHVSQLVYPSMYNGAIPLEPSNSLKNISDHEVNGLARIYPIGEQESRVNHPEQSGYFSGACGITYYGGGDFGASFDQTVWVADVVLNLIHVDKLRQQGSASKASRILEGSDFLASTDRAFRPVNMTVGPDGAMYIVDMYRQVIEHPEWIPDDIEKTLNLNDGKDKGRIYKVHQKGKQSAPFDVTQFDSFEGLLKSLSHPNQWVRTTAHRLLLENDLSPEQIPQLEKISTSSNEFARVHSMWLLAATQNTNPNLMVQWIGDAIPGVQENALIISEPFLTTHDPLLQKCIETLTDGDQRVRMQAALSISTIMDTPTYAEQSEAIKNGLLQAANMECDEWNINALTLAGSQQGIAILNEIIQNGKHLELQPLVKSLTRVVAKNRTDALQLLESIAGLKNANEFQTIITETLSEHVVATSTPSPFRTPLNDMEQSGDPALIAACARLRKVLGLDVAPSFVSISRKAIVQVEDKSLQDETRMKQMALIELLPYEQKSEVLFSLLSNKESLQIQEAALRQLWQSGAPEIGNKLVEKWSELGPSSRRSASDILLYKQMYHDALLTGLENGVINIGEMNFDLERRRTLLWWTDNEQTKKRAQALFSDSGVVNRKEVIDKMKGALALSGTVDEGSKVFEQLCAQCHIYGATGVDAGPVLTEINRKSKESLLHDILDPNAAVDTKYINHKLETEDGTLHVGMVADETDQDITIKKMGGITVTVPKSNIKSFSSLGTSMMIEGLEANMTVQDMANLLTFLQNAEG